MPSSRKVRSTARRTLSATAVLPTWSSIMQAASSRARGLATHRACSSTMKPNFSIWIPLRLFLAASNVAIVLQISAAPNQSASWIQGLGPVVASLFVFVWLVFVRRNSAADVSDPYSLAGPFLPPGKYPLRFWFAASWMLLMAGTAASIVELVSRQRLLPIDVMFFLWGLLTLGAVVANIRLSRSKWELS